MVKRIARKIGIIALLMLMVLTCFEGFIPNSTNAETVNVKFTDIVVGNSTASFAIDEYSNIWKWGDNTSIKPKNIGKPKYIKDGKTIYLNVKKVALSSPNFVSWIFIDDNNNLWERIWTFICNSNTRRNKI